MFTVQGVSFLMFILSGNQFLALINAEYMCVHTECKWQYKFEGDFRCRNRVGTIYSDEGLLSVRSDITQVRLPGQAGLLKEVVEFQGAACV